MQPIRCELCGSSDIMKQDGFFVCQNCKTKYSLDEARKLVGFVKIDKSEDIENLLTLARRFYDEHNYTESEKYYELAMREAPNHWEATFFRAYCHALNTISSNYDESLTTLSNGTLTALKLLKDYVDEDQQPDVLDIIVRMDILYFASLIAFMTRSGGICFNQLVNVNDRIIFLLRQLEDFIKLYYPQQSASLKRIQESCLSIVRGKNHSLKWRQRRHLAARLKAELKH